MPTDDKPHSREGVVLYDHAASRYGGTEHISSVINRGIHGWIVELTSLRYVEVVPNDGPIPWKEYVRSGHAGSQPKTG